MRAVRKAVLAALFATAVLAFAAGPAWAAAPVAIGPLDVQVWPAADPSTPNEVLVIVGVNLPASTKLPATVRLPMVEGGKISWAGELVATGAGDIQREPVIKDGTGGKYAEFEVSESRAAQIEIGGIPLSNRASGYSANVRYVQTVAATSTAFAVRLPIGATDVKITPSPVGAPSKNEAGESLYSLPDARLKTGAGTDIAVSYKIGQAQAGQSAPNSFNTVLAVLLGLVAVAFVVLLVVVQRGRQGASELDADEEVKDELSEGDVADADEPASSDDDWGSEGDDAFRTDD